MLVPLSKVMSGDQSFSEDLSIFTKWREVLEKYNDEQAAGDIFTGVWKRSFQGLRGLSFPVMVKQVNEKMNSRPYITDWNRWQKTDYWATPGEFMEAGGDCEDYTIAKYLALKSLGVPDSLMRITIVYDLQKRVPHAILLVKTGHDNVLVLDNQNPVAAKVENIHRYIPIYSINHNGWWYHQSPAIFIS